MEIKRYNQLNEAKGMDYFEAFNTYIKGQVVKDYFSVAPYGNKDILDVANRYFGEGIECENGYKMISYGGGCSGEDCNTSFIIDPGNDLVAKNDW